MKKAIAVMAVIVILFSAMCVEAKDENIFPSDSSTFENGKGQWEVFYHGKLIIKNDNGNEFLEYKRDEAQSWYSPIIDLYDVLKNDIENNGEALYKLEFDIKVTHFSDKEPATFNVLFRCGQEVSLEGKMSGDGKEYRCNLGNLKGFETEKWHHYENTFSVTEADVKNKIKWNLCFDGLDEKIEMICLDNVSIKRVEGEISNKAGKAKITDSTKIAKTATVMSKETVINTKAMLPKRTMRPLKAGNLVDAVSSNFNDASIATDTAWYGFSSGELKLSDSYDGNCIMLDYLPHSWSSPAINIRNYIDGAGTYSIGMMVRLTSKKDMVSGTATIRGKTVNSFMSQFGANVYANLGVQKFESGKWQYCSATFAVEDDDFNSNDMWEFCFGGLDDVTKIEIDDFALVNGEAENLPEQPEITENEAVDVSDDFPEAEDISLSGRETFFAPEMKSVIIKTSCVTAVIVLVYIVIAILIDKKVIKLKKGEKR